MGQAQFPAGPRAFFQSVSEWNKRIKYRVKKLKAFSLCHGGVVVKTVVLSKPKERESIPSLESIGRNRLGRMKKVWLFSNWSNWHGGVMVKAVVHQAQRGEGRFPAGLRALLSWFQSGRKELGSCNRFEELNK